MSAKSSLLVDARLCTTPPFLIFRPLNSHDNSRVTVVVQPLVAVRTPRSGYGVPSVVHSCALPPLLLLWSPYERKLVQALQDRDQRCGAMFLEAPVLPVSLSLRTTVRPLPLVLFLFLRLNSTCLPVQIALDLQVSTNYRLLLLIFQTFRQFRAIRGRSNIF